jgi:hypothetical protein
MCEKPKCPVCGKDYYILHSGMIVAGGCEHIFKQGQMAEKSVTNCEICGGTMIFDPSGQIVYWMDCTCLRDEHGKFANTSQALRAMNADAIGVEFVYLQSQAKRTLELNNVSLIGQTRMMQEILQVKSDQAAIYAELANARVDIAAIKSMFANLTPKIEPGEDFRCPMFLKCPKANATTKRCRDKDDSNIC